MQKIIREIDVKNAEEERQENEKIIMNNYYKHGKAYFNNEEYGKAIEEWNKMLEIDPENDLAKQYISKAEAEHEQKIISLVNRAEYYERAQKFTDAILILNNALRLNPYKEQKKIIEQRIAEYEKQFNFLKLFIRLSHFKKRRHKVFKNR